MTIVGLQDEPWLDDDAGRLVRPYTVSNGRTQPSTRMELLSMVMATAGPLPRSFFVKIPKFEGVSVTLAEELVLPW